MELHEERIYSDMRGEMIKTTTGIKIFLFDKESGYYNPNLILWNQLQIWKTIRFLMRCYKRLTGKDFDINDNF